MLNSASLLAGVMLALGPAAGQAVQSQTATAITETPNYIVPESLEGFASSVDTIAVGRCQRIEMLRDEVGSIVAQCHARIEEILKSGTAPMAVGEVVRVRVVGGRQIKDRLVPADDISGLQRGQRLVMFLHWVEAEKAFHLAAGLSGAYDVSTNTVEPLGKFPIAKAQRGKPKSEFVAELKGTAK
jgi:hypothetical protein